MSETDDNDTGTRQVFCVSKEVVNADLLRQLSIKVIGEENFGQGAVFMITATGVKKLIQHGYQKVSETAGAYEGLITVALTAPPATATAAALPNTATVAAAPAPAPVVPEAPKLTTTAQLWQSSGPNADFKDKVCKLSTDILIPALGKSVRIYVPHNDVVPPRAPPRDEGVFRIFIWGSGTASSGNEWRVPAKMWGIPVDCMDKGSFSAWEGGFPITTPEGQEVGACDLYNLYIYHDAIDKTTENELNILRKIFEAAASAIRNGCKIPIEIRRDAYVELCSKRYAAMVQQAKNTHVNLKTKVADYQRSLVEAVRQFMDAEKILDMHQQLGKQKDSKAGFIKEFDALLRVPLIEDVMFRGNTFTAHTRDITIVDPRTKLRHHLGKFIISVNTDDSKVKVINKTRQIDAHSSKMQAPHVFPDGNPCFGTLANTIPDLIAKYEFSTLIQVLLSYLGEVNMLDAAGRHAHKWPLIGADGTIETEADRVKRIKEFEKTKAFSEMLREDEADAEEDEEDPDENENEDEEET